MSLYYLVCMNALNHRANQATKLQATHQYLLFSVGEVIQRQLSFWVGCVEYTLRRLGPFRPL